MVRRLKSRAAAEVGRHAAASRSGRSSRSRCRTPTRRRRSTPPSSSTPKLRHDERAGQRRAVRDRVRAEDAEEAALLQPGRLPHHAGAARDVAATRPRSKAVAKPSVGIAPAADSTGWTRTTPTTTSTTRRPPTPSTPPRRLFAEPTADEELALLQADAGVGGTAPCASATPRPSS